MKLKDIVKHLHQLEGKRLKVSIANVRELVAILSDLVWAHPESIREIGEAGRKRAVRKAHAARVAAKKRSR